MCGAVPTWKDHPAAADPSIDTQLKAASCSRLGTVMLLCMRAAAFPIDRWGGGAPSLEVSRTTGSYQLHPGLIGVYPDGNAGYFLHLTASLPRLTGGRPEACLHTEPPFI